MTPKEKAEELIVNYKMQIIKLNYDEAKQCAIIAVNEVIDTLYYNRLDSGVTYWEEVKQEIENL